MTFYTRFLSEKTIFAILQSIPLPSLALNADEQTIQLLNKRDIDIFKRNFNYMHIGLVQIAFRPLTLKGLPETFLAALRDARNLNFRKSLMGSVESTLAYGPVYFNTQPNLLLSLTDVNILHALTGIPRLVINYTY